MGGRGEERSGPPEHVKVRRRFNQGDERTTTIPTETSDPYSQKEERKRKGVSDRNIVPSVLKSRLRRGETRRL